MIPLYAVIPVKNQIAYTRNLVGQLLDQAEGDLLLVDNGSTDGTRTWAEEDEALAVAPLFHFTRMPNANIHEMWNYGLDWAAADCEGKPHSVALLNNDLRIGSEFLSRLDATLRCDDRIAVAGANYDRRQIPDGKGCQIVRSVCGGRYDGTGGLPGFAMMLRGELGYRFPKDLRWWYGDADLVHTTVHAGRFCVISKHATCEHLDGGGRTGDWNSPEMQALLRQDHGWFERKWRGRASAGP